MNENRETASRTQRKGSSSGKQGKVRKIFLRVLFGVLLPIAVLIAGGKAALHLVDTGPKAERRSSGNRSARLVEVQAARLSSERTVVHAMGTVKAARTIDLQPRVSGEVIEVSDELLPGGILRGGEVILRIDPTDYELIVRQRSGELAHAESTFRLELGNQSVAQREYELLGETIRDEDRDLVLRKPQLRTVEAAVDIAKAVLEKARLDLLRTTVRAPFNAMVESYDINLGAQVSTASRLATLVGIDEYWIELSVPVDQLKWIRIPRAAHEPGSKARVYNEAAWGEGVHRTGHVVRLAAGLEPEGRMARLLVSVPDPLGLAEEFTSVPRLLIGSYLRVEIEGLELDNVVALRRRLLRDGDKVWIMNEEGRLDIRPVTIAYRGRDRMLVSGGILEGEWIVSTDLSAPVSGMPLRTDGGAAPSGAADPARLEEDQGGPGGEE